jgi:hypothetical protein
MKSKQPAATQLPPLCAGRIDLGSQERETVPGTAAHCFSHGAAET